MRQLCVPALAAALLVAGVSRASAQQPPETAACQSAVAERHDVINEKQHHYLGKVEFDCGDTKLYADEVWYFADENRAVATGNVLFRQGSSQIAADRAEFDTRTKLGTFYSATGFATVQPPRQPPRPGGVAPPPVPGEQTIVYYFGETVEKIGPRKYKISNGGFTTCVQPTPRWDLHADTVVLNLDHYTLLTNAILTAKGVPMLYLPIMFYPTKRGNRATGFLIPTYGASSLRGQSIHNAFFWAINRSQDATFTHDWFSKTGQGVGSEYRYNFGGGDEGSIRATMLDQHEATYSGTAGSLSTLPATRSYEVHGAANELLPWGLRARGSVDYFSSFSTMQTYNTNILAASQSQRTFGGNIVGAWGTYALNATLAHNEYFYTQTSSVLSGSWPRVAFTRNERPIAGTPFYFSVGTEYANFLSDRQDTSTGTLQETNLGLSRLDFSPQIRFPFRKWQWFTVNSTLAWRDTYYTASYAPGSTTAPLDGGLNRRFFTLATMITGPVFNRIFDTPGNGYAQKFKHSIEPFLNVQRTSSIDNFNRIVKLDSADYIVGGTTQFTYGVTNRLYAKRSLAPGQVATSREILTVDLRQTYYTDQQAAQFDRQYQTSNTVSGTAPTHFSPLALDVRAVPTNDFNATLHAEFDAQYRALRTIGVTGQYAWSSQLQTSVGWSKRNFIAGLPGFNNPALLDQSLNASANLHTRNNRYGAIYAFNYDVLHSTMLQQRMTGFYNAQCCGLAFEYQTYHFPSSVAPIAADHRFFLSFTLAGLGNFSPFNGALSGVPR